MYSSLHAQVVIEDVNFDFYQNVSNNDFVNHFSGGNGMTQLQTNGITGGCILVPDSISWGNDNAIYCSKYKPNTGDTTVTSVCFKYDSTTVQLSSFQRAVSVFLRPYADFNHYIIASVSANKKIEIITYGWVNTPYPNLNLLHNHWYQYKLSTAFFGVSSQVYIKAEVFDLGLSGVSLPALVNSSSGTITDNVLAVDTAIEVSVSGATYGGCLYLDNFHFQGRKGFSNCTIGTGIEDFQVSEALSVYYSHHDHRLHLVRNEKLAGAITVAVFNIEGKKIKEEQIPESQTEISFQEFTNGIYLVQCEAQNETKNYKVFVHN